MVILSFIFGVVITFFALGLVVHCKDNEPKNNVRFFVKRISIDYYSLCINSKYGLYTIFIDISLSDFGLNTDDFSDMKEGENREVFLNLEDNK